MTSPFRGEVVAVMRRGFRRESDALDEIFRFLGDFVDEAAIDDRDAFTINLVVEELFTNLVRHNNGGGESINIDIEREGDGFHLELTDFDVEPFDPTSVPRPPLTSDIDEIIRYAALRVIKITLTGMRATRRPE